MQVTVIAVGKVKEKYLQDGIAEYEKRLRPLIRLNILELSEEKRPANASPAQEDAAKRAEGNRIIAAIPDGSYTIALAIGGGLGFLCGWLIGRARSSGGERTWYVTRRWEDVSRTWTRIRGSLVLIADSDATDFFDGRHTIQNFINPGHT